MAIEPLIIALSDDTLDVRRLAADALSSIGEPAIDPLIKLFSKEDSELVARIKYVLWNIGNAVVVPLIKALDHDDWRVRMNAAYTLGEINYKRANDPPGMLSDPSAIFCLETKIDVPASKRDEELAVEPLIQTLGDEVADVRNAAVAALQKIGDLRAVEPITKALNDVDENVRVTATWALEKLKAK